MNGVVTLEGFIAIWDMLKVGTADEYTFQYTH